jgi:hypothetical protein
MHRKGRRRSAKNSDGRAAPRQAEGSIIGIESRHLGKRLEALNKPLSVSASTSPSIQR